jgi:GNAT superfamily N-acetyltransferase
MLPYQQAFVRIAFHMTPAWANPPGGLIPKPSDSDVILPLTHAAAVAEPIPDRRLFRFRLKWQDWGDHGRGYMPYEYFDRYVFESWASYISCTSLRQFKLKLLDEAGHIRWYAQDEDDHRIYAFEVHDPKSHERVAWTFVVERDGALEVEEMYVRPEYRRLGHGRWLAERVAQLAREKATALRLWVGFVDCRQENEANHPALVATIRRLGVTFQRSLVPWAAYYGSNESQGEENPVEPHEVPLRPRGPRQELLAIALAFGLGQGSQEPTVGPPIPAHHEQERQVAVASAEWNDLNAQRAALIDKKYSPGRGLTAEEELRLEQLQRQFREAVNQAFPRPGLTPEELEIINRALENEGSGGSA